MYRETMKRRDQGKASFVDVMRSIKFTHAKEVTETECATHFAPFSPRARATESVATEDTKLVRSAN